MPYNCKGCGKCCIWTTFKDKSFHDFFFFFPDSMKLIYGRCSNLNENNECMIYNIRPESCVKIQRGDNSCLNMLSQFENN